MRNLIVAPHIDDELIGCYSVLEKEGHKTDVLYLYDLSPERKAEAEHGSQILGFGILNFFPRTKDTYSKIYVPSRHDWHAQHKEAYLSYRTKATHFYSVDMVGGKPLSTEDQERKKYLLDTIYPSQKALWERDHKYFLFESIATKDYAEYVTLEYPGGFSPTKIVIEKLFADEAQQAMTQIPEHSFEEIAQALIPIVGTSRLEITIGDVKRVYE